MGEEASDAADWHRRIEPGEELCIYWPDETFSRHRVQPDGQLTLPFIGEIQAAGETTHELHQKLVGVYVLRFYKAWPDLRVRRTYYVQGQVLTSGRQEYLGPTTVLKAIATAGDFTGFAHRRRVVLTRADGTRILVDCVKAAKDSSYDLPVYPGDKIEVPQTTPPGLFEKRIQ
jgi:polysaccharide export outer membrane protein